MLTAALLWLVKDFLFFLSYVSSHTSFPHPLSPQEEQENIRKMQDGDAQARNRLVEHNLRLVAHIVRKYTVPGMDSDDLISIGTIGLIKAVSTFNPKAGNSLSTYASRCIENELLMCLRSSKKRRHDVSLSDPIGMDADGNEIALIDVLGSDADVIIDEVDRNISLAKINTLINEALPARERMVIKLRYGLLDGVSHAQYEIAELMGISRSYVSRIEKHAVQLLEQGLHGKKIRAAD